MCFPLAASTTLKRSEHYVHKVDAPSASPRCRHVSLVRTRVHCTIQYDGVIRRGICCSALPVRAGESLELSLTQRPRISGRRPRGTLAAVSSCAKRRPGAGSTLVQVAGIPPFA